MKIKILTISEYYLPGYRAGGPIRTIENMVKNLSDEFEFLIITKDRDLGDRKPYAGIDINQWNKLSDTKIFYASPKYFTWLYFKKILKETDYDILYLNSFFSYQATVSLLLLRLFGFIEKKAVVIAPRGEFSSGALQIKSFKKKLYITIARRSRLYNGLVWQASSKYEMQDIKNRMGHVAKNILIAPDLLAIKPQSIMGKYIEKPINRQNSTLNVIFLSRISPKKNLDFLLRALQKVRSPVVLSIYGSLEDTGYWSECQTLIEQLPVNVIVKYKGELTPEEVSTAFVEHDVFFFPTRGENFGHVIFEALASGTCTVLSDQTPWKKDKGGAVEVIPLDDTSAWSAALERWTQYSEDKLNKKRKAALQYAREYVITSPALEQNRQLFLEACATSH